MNFFFVDCIAQTIQIGSNRPLGKVLISEIEGEKIKTIDSIVNHTDKNLIIKLNKTNIHTGLYRLTFENKAWLQLIYENEDIEIETDAHHIIDSLKIIKSESNKIYYEFIKRNKEYKTKSKLLQLILSQYPEDDNYYQTTKEKLNQVQEDYLYFVNVISQTNPNSFAARYIMATQLPVIDIAIPSEKQLDYLKSHTLDNINFNDEDLVYSNAFTNKIIEYLTYYRNPGLNRELLEKEFMFAVDTVLTRAKVNQRVYQQIIEYLLDGFRNSGFDSLIEYIVENYVIKDNICLNQELSKTLDRRINQAKIFRIGTIVPNIVLPDSAGALIELNKINAENTLIIFYASWCPHCQNLLPRIYDIYKRQNEKKFEIFAVSIDTSRSEWLNFVRTNNLNWLNVSDLKGWDGQVAKEYYLYATPTMFLINNEKKIISKPITFEELINWL